MSNTQTHESHLQTGPLRWTWYDLQPVARSAQGLNIDIKLTDLSLPVFTNHGQQRNSQPVYSWCSECLVALHWIFTESKRRCGQTNLQHHRPRPTHPLCYHTAESLGDVLESRFRKSMQGPRCLRRDRQQQRNPTPAQPIGEFPIRTRLGLPYCPPAPKKLHFLKCFILTSCLFQFFN